MLTRYAKARWAKSQEDEAFRSYVSDTLKALAGAKVRYADIIHPVPDFDAEAVVDDVISRAGLEVL